MATETNLPQRMWVNQPSTFQVLHHMHGQNVLAVRDGHHYWRIYPLWGDTVSLRAPSNTLSEGWLTDTTIADLLTHDDGVRQDNSQHCLPDDLRTQVEQRVRKD